MSDADSPPRLRRRLLGWIVGGLLFLGCFYILALGPLNWWARHQRHIPAWVVHYEHSLSWQFESSTLRPIFVPYVNWWSHLPPLRSWERRNLRVELAEARADLVVEEKMLEICRREHAEAQRRLTLARSEGTAAFEHVLDYSHHAAQQLRDAERTYHGTLRRIEVRQQELRALE